jgi:hypothetical protein
MHSANVIVPDQANRVLLTIPAGPFIRPANELPPSPG